MVLSSSHAPCAKRLVVLPQRQEAFKYVTCANHSSQAGSYWLRGESAAAISPASSGAGSRGWGQGWGGEGGEGEEEVAADHAALFGAARWGDYCSVYVPHTPFYLSAAAPQARTGPPPGASGPGWVRTPAGKENAGAGALNFSTRIEVRLLHTTLKLHVFLYLAPFLEHF